MKAKCAVTDTVCYASNCLIYLICFLCLLTESRGDFKQLSYVMIEVNCKFD